MLIDYWPVQALLVSTPRLELRPVSDDDLAELAALAGLGIHGAELMPFGTPWTDLPPVERGRSLLQWAWRQRAGWAPESWSLVLGVRAAGRLVGVQDLRASDLAVLGEVATGSWLGLEHQGHGIGTEMRAAVLHLAFAELGARWALSGSHEDNAASYEVSRKLGYADDGLELRVVRGAPATFRRLRLSREHWAQRASTPVTVAGLDGCRAMFGVR